MTLYPRSPAVIMIDFIECDELTADARKLLRHPCLCFTQPWEIKTGEVQTYKHSRAELDGITFTCCPTIKDKNRFRVKLEGSLHKYHNHGIHNADDFTYNDLVIILDQLVAVFEIDAHQSPLNGFEFGVNIQLSFPVKGVLDKLICHKNKPFLKDSRSGYECYVITYHQYTIKIYDKGLQFPNHPQFKNTLRFEIKVNRMEFLKQQCFKGIQLITLSDLIRADNYPLLGRKLIKVFDEILFDEPSIKQQELTTKEKELYLKGSNPKYWQEQQNEIDQLDKTNQQRLYDAKRKQLARLQREFRLLVDRHRQHDDWRNHVIQLLGQKWYKLFTIHSIQEGDADNLKLPHCIGTTLSPNCPKLNGFKSLPTKGKMSQIDTLPKGSNCDKGLNTTAHWSGFTTAYEPRPTASQLRNDPELLANLQQGRRRYAKGSKEDEAARAAHNLRNDESNPRNNLIRRIWKSKQKLQQSPELFDTPSFIRLSIHQQRILDYWKGTPFEIDARGG